MKTTPDQMKKLLHSYIESGFALVPIPPGSKAPNTKGWNKPEAAIKTECNKRLSKWFTVSQLRTNIVPPQSLQETIIAKTKAIQQAQAEDQKALTAEAEARKKVAIANGNAQQTIIEAKAQAEAMQIRKKEINPLYIEYLKWIDVDPNTPRVPQVVGSTAVLNQLK
jgi:hypothetical protein